MTDAGTAVRIVVGVDGSDPSLQALHWAMGQAETTGAHVEAVSVWDIPTPYGAGPTVLPGEDLAGEAERALGAAVAEVAGVHPGVPVERLVVRGRAAPVLLDRAKRADLLVIGSHGRTGLVGALLGSVSRTCIEHASCPVVVVPTKKAATSG